MIKMSRPCFERKSVNLFNLMKEIWPCNNFYIPTCKDAAYGRMLGMAQNFTIGKVDPADKSKMICQNGLDKPEVIAYLLVVGIVHKVQ